MASPSRDANRASAALKLASGVGLVQAGCFLEAIRAFDAALALDPANVDAQDSLDETREMLQRELILADLPQAEEGTENEAEVKGEVPLTPEPTPYVPDGTLGGANSVADEWASRSGRRLQKMQDEQRTLDTQYADDVATLAAEQSSQLQARQITEEERALAAHYLPAAAIPTEGALGGVAPAAQEGWVKVWGRKLGMSEAKLGSVDRHVTKIRYQGELLLGHPAAMQLLGRAKDKVDSTMASSDTAVILKRDVLEMMRAKGAVSEVTEDPELLAMVEEFRASRGFLREVLAFTDEACRHTELELATAARITELLRGEAHGDEEEGGLTPAQRLRRHASLSSVDEAAMAESSLAELLLDVAARSEAIAHLQQRYLEAVPSLRAVLLKYLDVISPDAESVLARYERARLKYDAFRLEVDAAIARGDDGERLGRMKANRDESEMRMMQLQQQAGFKLALCREKVTNEVGVEISKAWEASASMYGGGAQICRAFYAQREQAFAAVASY